MVLPEQLPLCLLLTSTHADKHTQHTPVDVPEPTHGNNPPPHPTPAVLLPSNSPLWLIYRSQVKLQIILRSWFCFQNLHQMIFFSIMETLNCLLRLSFASGVWSLGSNMPQQVPVHCFFITNAGEDRGNNAVVLHPYQRQTVLCICCQFRH